MLINDTLHTTSPLRQRIRDYYRISESVAVDQILPIAEVNPRARSRAWETRTKDGASNSPRARRARWC